MTRVNQHLFACPVDSGVKEHLILLDDRYKIFGDLYNRQILVLAGDKAADTKICNAMKTFRRGLQPGRTEIGLLNNRSLTHL